MNKFRREVTIEILVGLFMFTVLIALGVFTIVLSRENLLRKSYEYEFVFSDVSGLRRGDNVYLRGMNIGRVQQTELDEGNVRVYVTLEEELALRKGYKIEIVNASMLGGKFLRIDEGDSSAPLLGPNITILGSEPVDVIQELSSAVNGLQSMINEVGEGKGTLGMLLNDDAFYNNLVVMSEDLKEVSGRLARGEGMLGRLLSADDTMYEDAAVMVSNLRDVSERLASGQGTIGKLLSEDDQVYNDLQASMASIRRISERLAEGKGTLGKLMGEDDQVYEDLKASMAAIRSISEGISEGEGTFGRLVRDEKLYDEATLLVEDVRAAVDDLREASPITSFGSVLFGAF
jgi:phospholipid/cholesterol/gamma-HCH transport system substrate-binding protein